MADAGMMELELELELYVRNAGNMHDDDGMGAMAHERKKNGFTCQCELPCRVEDGVCIPSDLVCLYG